MADDEQSPWNIALFGWIALIAGVAFAGAAVVPDGWRRLLTVVLILLAGISAPKIYRMPRRARRLRILGLAVVGCTLIAALPVALIPVESFVERCLRRHDGPFEEHTALLERANRDAKITWQECYEPPLAAGVDDDGYAKITSQYYIEPNTANAATEFAVQVLKTSCEWVTFEYGIFVGGGNSVWPARTVRMGQYVDTEGKDVLVPDWFESRDDFHQIFDTTTSMENMCRQISRTIAGRLSRPELLLLACSGKFVAKRLSHPVEVPTTGWDRRAPFQVSTVRRGPAEH